MPKIRISEIDFELELVERLQDVEELKMLNGNITYSKPIIRIESTQDKQNIYQIIWHEIIHGIVTLNIQEEINENTVDRLAHGICQVLRDNKKLLDEYYPWDK